MKPRTYSGVVSYLQHKQGVSVDPDYPALEIRFQTPGLLLKVRFDGVRVQAELAGLQDLTTIPGQAHQRRHHTSR